MFLVNQNSHGVSAHQIISLGMIYWDLEWMFLYGVCDAIIEILPIMLMVVFP